MLIRFVVGNDADHHRSLTGIITEARILRDKGGLNPDQVSWLEEVYAWFDATLPTLVKPLEKCGRSPLFSKNMAFQSACFGQPIRAGSSILKVPPTHG